MSQPLPPIVPAPASDAGKRVDGDLGDGDLGDGDLVNEEHPEVDGFAALLEAGREASRTLATATTEVKNRALRGIAQALRDNVAAIVAANALDLAAGAANGLGAGLI